MRSLILIFFVIAIGFIPVKGQQPVPARTPSEQQRVSIQIREEQKRMQELDRLKSISSTSTGNTIPSTVWQNINQLYRKPTNKELEVLMPDEEDVKKYAGFLQQSGTGLTRLASDLGCAENTNVVVASADCLKYSMPGGGSSYSFRIENYRISRLADLTFTDNSFQATGALLHGILVGIGDVELDKVNLQTTGLDFLVEFQPVTEFEKAKEIDKQYAVGIYQSGFIYRRALRAVENMTYVLRSIAYKGVNYRAVQGIIYNELDFDKRKDVIVAFRIVRKHDDGGITILWKQLSRKDSPKIIRKVKSKVKDIKDNNFTAKNVRNK